MTSSYNYTKIKLPNKRTPTPQHPLSPKTVVREGLGLGNVIDFHYTRTAARHLKDVSRFTHFYIQHYIVGICGV